MSAIKSATYSLFICRFGCRFTCHGAEIFILCLVVNFAGLAAQTPATSKSAPGLEKEQPARRNLRNPNNYASGRAPSSSSAANPSAENLNAASPSKDSSGAVGGQQNQTGQDTQNESHTETSAIEPSAPHPPYPNYPESNLPRPPRAPKQQEYLYLNHLYFEPLTLAIGGFVSFGWLGMIRSGKALRLGMDIYNSGTNLSVILQGQGDNDAYRILGLLWRVGLHFFLEPTQLKGFEVGFDLRSGLAVLPVSGNAVVFQVALEFPIAYRFVMSFYSQTGRQTLNMGFAPYVALSVGGYLATSSLVSVLRDNDRGFFEYMSNGNLFIEPNFVDDIDPIALKIGIRFGFDVSFVF